MEKLNKEFDPRKEETEEIMEVIIPMETPAECCRSVNFFAANQFPLKNSSQIDPVLTRFIRSCPARLFLYIFFKILLARPRKLFMQIILNIRRKSYAMKKQPVYGNRLIMCSRI
jgi:hypothetical protein